MAYSLIDTSSATKTASRTYTTYAASNAFDGNTGTWWWCPWPPDSSDWLKIDFGGAAKTVTQIKLYHSDTVTLTGNLDGSNNNTDWTTIDTFSHAATDTWYTEEFSNSTAYRYYRIVGTGTGGNWWKVHEWELYETVIETVVKDIIGGGFIPFAR